MFEEFVGSHIFQRDRSTQVNENQIVRTQIPKVSDSLEIEVGQLKDFLVFS